MHNPITFIPAELWSVFIAFVAGVLTLNQGMGVVQKAIAWLKKPDSDQNAKLEDHEQRITAVEKKLDNDNKRLEDTENLRKIELRALLALTRHSLDGNNVRELKQAETDLQNYLVDK